MGASAAATLEMMAKAQSASITTLRSIRPITNPMSRADSIPLSPVAVTACPARPLEIPKPSAIGVSSPAGRNSLNTSAKVARASEPSDSRVLTFQAAGA